MLRNLWLKQVYWKLRPRRISGLLAGRFRCAFPRRLACYQRYRRLFKKNIGLEIGGPSDLFKRHSLFPVYAVAARIDNLNFSHQTIWEGAIKEGANFLYDERHAPGKQFIGEGNDLGHIASASYDFVLSSHALEHMANPLRALSEWIRVLKSTGLLVLVLPHRDGTFDHRRPVTSLAHLIRDFEMQTTEEDLTHLEEILQLHDLSRDPGAGDIAAFKRRSERNIENRCLHHHVFDTRLAVDVVHHIGLQVLAVDVFRPFNIFVVAQKRMQGKGLQNERFMRTHGVPSWRSPFPSDQPVPTQLPSDDEHHERRLKTRTFGGRLSTLVTGSKVSRI